MKPRLPLEHKPRIQRLYIRFRDLSHESKAVDSNLGRSRAVFWISLITLIFWLVRLFVGEELPDILGGFALLATPVSWLYLRELREKSRSLFRENLEIKRELQKYGALLSDTLGQITVYAEKISDETVVDPMSDSTYALSV